MYLVLTITHWYDIGRGARKRNIITSLCADRCPARFVSCLKSLLNGSSSPTKPFSPFLSMWLNYISQPLLHLGITVWSSSYQWKWSALTPQRKWRLLHVLPFFLGWNLDHAEEVNALYDKATSWKKPVSESPVNQSHPSNQKYSPQNVTLKRINYFVL